MSRAEILKEIEEAASIANGKPCPITGKMPSENRCHGQLQKRMMSGGQCTGVCDPKFDDLRIRRLGGNSSL